MCPKPDQSFFVTFFETQRWNSTCPKKYLILEKGRSNLSSSFPNRRRLIRNLALKAKRERVTTIKNNRKILPAVGNISVTSYGLSTDNVEHLFEYLFTQIEAIRLSLRAAQALECIPYNSGAACYVMNSVTLFR